MNPALKTEELEAALADAIGPQALDEFTLARYQRLAEDVLGRDSEHSAAHTLLAVLANMRGDHIGAQRSFEAAFYSAPNPTRALNLALSMSQFTDRGHAALAILRDVIANEPDVFDQADDLWPMQVAIVVFARSGYLSEAEDLFVEVAGRCDHNSVSSMFSLACAAMALSDLATVAELVGRMAVALGEADWHADGGVATFRRIADSNAKLSMRGDLVQAAMEYLLSLTVNDDVELSTEDQRHHDEDVAETMAYFRPLREQATALVLEASDG